MKWVRKGLIWFHRYLGIGLSLLFVVWFLSGIGMIFARGMPGLSPDVRLQRLPEIDLSRILLSPTDASAGPAQRRETQPSAGQPESPRERRDGAAPRGGRAGTEPQATRGQRRGAQSGRQNPAPAETQGQQGQAPQAQ